MYLLKNATVRAALASALVCAACGVTDEGALPPDVPDPASVKTTAGALAFYRQVVARLPAVLDGLVVDGGVLTDELAALPVPPLVAGRYYALDSRQEDLGDVGLDGTAADLATHHWNGLHALRAQAREARGFLTAYAPDSSPALRGHLFALEGYAEIFLADLFCSGIPLSTVDYGGDYTLAAGSSTAQVYGHAVTLFDSALARIDSAESSDADSLRHFAAVGRGRALLARGDFAAAAAAVAAVPDGFRSRAALDEPAHAERERLSWLARTYRLPIGPDGIGTGTSVGGTPSVADREGGNGLDYRSSGDPRIAAAHMGQDSRGHDMYLPAKYLAAEVISDDVGNPIDTLYTVPLPLAFTVASGVEARLIEAEAALQASPDDGRWLALLNGLRRTALPDTVLPDTTDPGPGASRNAPRVDLLFRERAFWLYLTAHRQGDLRRLIRDPAYFRRQETVYPTGSYPGGAGVYGSAVVVPVPQSEQELNPQYTGCIHREA